MLSLEELFCSVDETLPEKMGQTSLPLETSRSLNVQPKKPAPFFKDSFNHVCQTFEPQWKQQILGCGLQLRNRPPSLSLREIMTILIAFHQSCSGNFKTYAREQVQTQWGASFPGLVSQRALHRMGSEYPSAEVRRAALLFWQV